ncbi:MAG TPA: FtsX-like permease family protein [Trebonia sp.]|nr:FtsX-like permease family protein [Trebonia sp.]
MTAHWVVLAAATLTTLVAATVAAALAVFGGQALALAVRHDLSAASGTALSVTAQVSAPGQATSDTATLKQAIGGALPGIPFSFNQALWSDPLGLVPGTLPGTPASAGQGNIPTLEAASMSGIESHAVLVSGTWPAATGTSQPVPAALPASAAALLHVSVGNVLTLRDRISNATVRFKVTGLFAPRRAGGPAAAYWALDELPASGVSATSGFATYGPLVVEQPAIGTLITANSGAWVAQPDMAAFTGGDLGSVAASITSLSGAISGSTTLSGAQLTTSLPAVLTHTANSLTAARSLLVVSALQLLVLAAAALLAVARLLATQREGEAALLAARGATRWQLARLTAAEVIPLSLATAAAGAVAGIALAGVLAGAGPLATAGIRVPGGAGTWLDAIAAAAVVAVIAIVALLAPVLGSSGANAGPGAARVRRGRQALVAGVSRAGLDLGLIVLAVLTGWQLRRYSAVTGTAGIDLVLTFAPALALAAGTVVTLRLLPMAARAADRLSARGKGLVASLAGWQFSRQPLRQGGAALLIVMAVATGTLALAQHASWDQSASDQSAFAAGGDVRVDVPVQLDAGKAGAVTAAAGVQHAMAVSVESQAAPAEVLALSAAQAPQVVRLRGDESALPPARLFGAIDPAGQLPGTVLTAPQPGTGAGLIQLTATLAAMPASAASDARLASALGPVTVTLTVLDSSGTAYQVSAGTLTADGQPSVLRARLGGTRVGYPLRLAGITASYTLPYAATSPAALTISGVSLAGWKGDASSPDLVSILGQGQQSSPQPPPGQPASISSGTSARSATFAFKPGHGYTTAFTGKAPEPVPAQLVMLPPAAPAPAIPAVATQSFISSSNTSVGSVIPTTLDGVQVPLKIVAVAASFPTVTATGGALIADLSVLQEYLTRQDLPPLPVTEFWLATFGRQVPPSLAASLPAGSAITSTAALTASTTGDPLSAAPQVALLAMAAAAVLLAITGFWVSIAANVRQRRAETALLAALGVTPRAAALQLFLEKLMLSLPSAALGLVLGLVVARLFVPAVTLTPAATQPVPPAVTLYDLPQALPLALAVAILPAAAAALAVLRRPDPAAELRAAEAA